MVARHKAVARLTGYGLHRELGRRGYRSQIAAPSLIPRRPGVRAKNDRRDCVRVAELSRAGELKSIWVPDEAHEAMRNPLRAREGAVGMKLKSRRQLQGFLLRHGRRCPGKTHWTKSHERWIAEVIHEMQDQLCLVVPARHRIARQRRIGIEAIVELPLELTDPAPTCSAPHGKYAPSPGCDRVPSTTRPSCGELPSSRSGIAHCPLPGGRL